MKEMLFKTVSESGIQHQKSKLVSLFTVTDGQFSMQRSKSECSYVGSPDSTNQGQGQMGLIIASKIKLGSIFDIQIQNCQMLVKIHDSK